jgi:hypothetical protein
MGIAASDFSTLSISNSECTATADSRSIVYTERTARHGSRQETYVVLSRTAASAEMPNAWTR